MRDLLSRGIGVHHGGLLPLVKEVRGRKNSEDASEIQSSLLKSSLHEVL